MVLAPRPQRSILRDRPQQDRRSGAESQRGRPLAYSRPPNISPGGRKLSATRKAGGRPSLTPEGQRRCWKPGDASSSPSGIRDARGCGAGSRSPSVARRPRGYLGPGPRRGCSPRPGCSQVGVLSQALQEMWTRWCLVATFLTNSATSSSATALASAWQALLIPCIPAEVRLRVPRKSRAIPQRMEARLRLSDPLLQWPWLWLPRRGRTTKRSQSHSAAGTADAKSDGGCCGRTRNFTVAALPKTFVSSWGGVRSWPYGHGDVTFRVAGAPALLMDDWHDEHEMRGGGS